MQQLSIVFFRFFNFFIRSHIMENCSSVSFHRKRAFEKNNRLPRILDFTKIRNNPLYSILSIGYFCGNFSLYSVISAWNSELDCKNSYSLPVSNWRNNTVINFALKSSANGLLGKCWNMAGALNGVWTASSISRISSMPRGISFAATATCKEHT